MGGECVQTQTSATITREEILRRLEQHPHTPLELAQALGSTKTDMYRQIALLEKTGLVKQEHPGTYTIAGRLNYMISHPGEESVQGERNKAAIRIQFLEDPEIRCALEAAFQHIEHSLPQIERITYAGLEHGKPVIEVAGDVSLPRKVDVDCRFGSVILQQDKEPSGYILYQR